MLFAPLANGSKSAPDMSQIHDRGFVLSDSGAGLSMFFMTLSVQAMILIQSERPNKHAFPLHMSVARKGTMEKTYAVGPQDRTKSEQESCAVMLHGNSVQSQPGNDLWGPTIVSTYQPFPIGLHTL
jgi:hypothetical protein